MTKDFDAVKTDMIQAYVDNYNAEDSNKEVESWINDSYPAFDVTVDNSAMSKDLSYDDVNHSDRIIKVNNEGDLQDKTFTLDDDKWVIQ